MKITMTLDMDAEKIVELTDQLTPKQFGQVQALMESRARERFGSAMLQARKEFRRAGLTRKHADEAVEAARAEAK
jgi:hypothetical protein